MTCSMTACRRWSASACSITQGRIGEHGVVTPGREQLTLGVRDEVVGVLVAHSPHDQPGGHGVFLAT
jgi:hypothetical protein